MASVEIRELRKSFGSSEVLHGLSFAIPDGSFVALVGPSGCGKSTVLRLIAGLEEITAGEVLIGDKVINEVESKNRDIAMVFQNYALYPHFTVEQNLGFSLRLLRKSKKEIAKAVKDAAVILGIDELLHRFPKQLSGGQRQRVAMGRAIVRQPQVFLFDEPLSNLDAKLRVQMRAELKTLHQRLKTTMIYVTHDQIEAMTMADIIVVMRDGNVEQVGSPLDLYDYPTNKFVAGFIGSPAMNFFKISTKAGSADAVLENGQQLVLPQIVELDGEYTAGFRPENIHPSQDDTGFLVQIKSTEQTGSETFLQAFLGDLPLTILLRERYETEPGKERRFFVEPKNVMLFEKKSGNRIELQTP